MNFQRAGYIAEQARIVNRLKIDLANEENKLIPMLVELRKDAELSGYGLFQTEFGKHAGKYFWELATTDDFYISVHYTLVEAIIAYGSNTIQWRE